VLQPNLNVHDDLSYWFESEHQFEDNIETIIEHMLDVRFPWLCVPLNVELKTGPNWAEVHEIGAYTSDKWLGWPKRAAEFV
jgi:DNA polymerase I-like protein with 3'-5' exonuclease and polymerase domains